MTTQIQVMICPDCKRIWINKEKCEGDDCYGARLHPTHNSNVDHAENYNEEIQNFINDLPLLMSVATGLGLYKTGHALHEAIRTVGYEFANMIGAKTDMEKAMSESHLNKKGA